MTNYYLVALAVFVLLTGLVARRKGYWFLMGGALGLLGPLGLVVALCLLDKKAPVHMTFKNRTTAHHSGAVWRPPADR